MKLRLQQLAGHLQKSLAPIYVVTGDEPLQLDEACRQIRSQAKQQGYTDRQVFEVDRNFDWQQIAAAAGAMSLFAERRLLEVRLPSAKPGDAGAKFLKQYTESPPEDNLLLLVMGKLEAAQMRSKWLTALEQAGVLIQIWPVEVNQLPDWIRQRMQTRQLQPSDEAVRLLADRVEGNLLAADQELEKLLLLNGPGSIDAEDVMAAVSDSARFDTFSMIDAALGGQTERCLRMANGLRGEGVELPVLVGALAFQLRQVCQLALGLAHGQGLEQLFAQHRVWPKKQPLLKSALQRHPVAYWQSLLAKLADIDRSSKGFRPGRAWDELVQLLIAIGSQPLLAVPLTSYR